MPSLEAEGLSMVENLLRQKSFTHDEGINGAQICVCGVRHSSCVTVIIIILTDYYIEEILRL